MTTDPRPFLPRGVRLHFDRVRKTNVLLGPERTLMLDEIGHAILTQVDGKKTVSDIATHLSVIYNAPQEAILTDVKEFLNGIADKRLIELAHD